LKAQALVALVCVAPVVANCAPELVGASELGGVIDNAPTPKHAEGFAVADMHCRQFGKLARVRESLSVNSFAFDCVNPPGMTER
jgi:hypothetical protein